MDAVTAVVLAGGKSTRMGSDKALLEFSGRRLLSHALELARSVTSEVRIAGDPAKFGIFGPTIPDAYPDRGPLGGIHAALAGSNSDLNLVIGVDLPFLEPRFLQYLIGTAERNQAFVTVPRTGQFYEPLCAVYRKEFASLADQALTSGRNKVDALFTGVPTYTVNEQELLSNGFSPAMFRNVNTPEDWKQALEELDRRKHV